MGMGTVVCGDLLLAKSYIVEKMAKIEMRYVVQAS